MYKLAIFTVAMVLLPIGTYFLSRDYLFSRAHLSLLPPPLAPLLLSPSLPTQADLLQPPHRNATAKTSLTYPAISAVTVANAVLIAFIYVAFREDADDAAREKLDKVREKSSVGKVE